MARRLAFVRPRTDAAPRSSTSKSKGLLYPLDVAFERAGIATPEAYEVRADEIPLPYHPLLVHERNMTMTIEQHYGCGVALRTLETFTRGRSYFRHVLLVQEDSGRPVEMGAIRLDLDALEPNVRAAVIEAKTPIGRLFRENGVAYLSRPIAFMALTPNSEMMGVFWMRESRTLYGRRTELRLDGKQIGDVVEVLPPV